MAFATSLHTSAQRAHRLYRRLLTASLLRTFYGRIGRGTILFRPGLVIGADRIFIGARCLIRYGCRLEIVRHDQGWTPCISIGDDVNIEQNVHIVCHDTIEIGDRVSITGHCALVDVTHPAAALAEGGKIGDAIDTARSRITIGDDSFLGFGAIVLPNVRIGRGCVVGAGSVVTTNVPDHAIVAGVPARIIGSTLP